MILGQAGHIRVIAASRHFLGTTLESQQYLLSVAERSILEEFFNQMGSNDERVENKKSLHCGNLDEDNIKPIGRHSSHLAKTRHSSQRAQDLPTYLSTSTQQFARAGRAQDLPTYLYLLNTGNDRQFPYASY